MKRKLSSLFIIFAYVAVLQAQPVLNPPLFALNLSSPPAIGVHPFLAANTHSGTMAIVWTTAAGTSSGSTIRAYPSSWTSQIYAAFSEDRGNTWSTPVALSDPTLNSSQPSVTAGTDPAEFYIAWSSGDIFSGYRQHLARTVDNGHTFTSSTREQTLSEPGQGILYPKVQLANGAPTIGWAAVDANETDRPYALYTTTATAEAGFLAPIKQIATTGKRLAPRPFLFSGGNTLIAAGINVAGATTMPAPTIFLTRSEDGGSSWSQPIFPAQNPAVYSVTPNLASDGNGTWVLCYFGTLSGSQEAQRFGKLYFQRSTDDGRTWTNPTLIDGILSPTDAPIGLATNKQGRWVAHSGSNYIYSNDNGATWTSASVPGSSIRESPGDFSYLGGGKWAFLERGFVPIHGTYLRILEWEEAAVEDWELY